MATQAQMAYYEALTAKQNRDAQPNPIMTAAAQGWAKGIDRGLKSKQENDDNLKKGMLKNALDSKEARIKLADTMITKYQWLDNGKPATPNALMDLHEGIVNGKPDDKRFRRAPETEKQFAPPEDKTIPNLNTQITGLQRQLDSLTKEEKDSGVDNSAEKQAIKDNIYGLRNQLSKKTGGGVFNRTVTPGKPAVKKYGFGGWDWTKADEPAIPSTEQVDYIPPGQSAPAQTPVQQQTPTMPVETVQKVGQAALDAHYKYKVLNPDTGTKEYSDDGKNWVDISGKSTQGTVITELQKAGAPLTQANIEAAIRQLSGVK
jgi:hypothetical protein